jgi:hypothetical protein
LQLCWIFKYFTSFILIWYRVVIYI